MVVVSEPGSKLGQLWEAKLQLGLAGKKRSTAAPTMCETALADYGGAVRAEEKNREKAAFSLHAQTISAKITINQHRYQHRVLAKTWLAKARPVRPQTQTYLTIVSQPNVQYCHKCD